MKKVYLDNAATTALDERALQKMLPYFVETYGNASGLHSFGREARRAIDEARDRMASLLGCSSKEIYFTGGGSESDNWALRGVFRAMKERGNHIVTTAIEHPAVLNTCRDLEKEGATVTYVGVDGEGKVSVAEIEKAIRPNTALVSVMYANNETGVIQPVEEIGKLCEEKGVYFHTDAVQAVGSIRIDVKKTKIDLLSLSAHKFHGPKGTGVLYVREGVRIAPLIFGGEQERGGRAGTSNTPAIVGMAEAFSLSCAEMEKNNARIRSLRDMFVEKVLSEIPDAVLNGGNNRLSGHADILFRGVKSETLLTRLDCAGIAASAGSACSAGSTEPSYVLRAMGRTEEEALSSVRFTFGRDTTEEETVYAAEEVKKAVLALRASVPLFALSRPRPYSV